MAGEAPCGRVGSKRGAGSVAVRVNGCPPAEAAVGEGPVQVRQRAGKSSAETLLLLGEFVAEQPPDRGLLIRRPGVGLADRARQVGEARVEKARPAQGVLARAGEPEVEEDALDRAQFLPQRVGPVGRLEDVEVAPASRQAIFQAPQVAAETFGLLDEVGGAFDAVADLDQERLLRLQVAGGGGGVRVEQEFHPNRRGRLARRSVGITARIARRLRVRRRIPVRSGLVAFEKQLDPVAPGRRQHGEPAAVGQGPPAPFGHLPVGPFVGLRVQPDLGRRIVAQVPGRAMEAGFGRQAFEGSDQFVLLVEDPQLHASVHRFRDPVVDQGAVGRVRAGRRHVGLGHRRAAGAEAVGGPGRQQRRSAVDEAAGNLAQGRQIVEDPDAPAEVATTRSSKRSWTSIQCTGAGGRFAAPSLRRERLRQFAPSSNETWSALSVPRKRSPGCSGSSRIAWTLASGPRGRPAARSVQVAP